MGSINFTDKARTYLLTLVYSNFVIRLSVQGGGCDGKQYMMTMIDKKETGDKDFHFDLDGLEVVVDPKSALFLDGVSIDYTDGLNGKGFTYTNPNAKRTCGCGTSFS